MIFVHILAVAAGTYLAVKFIGYVLRSRGIAVRAPRSVLLARPKPLGRPPHTNCSVPPVDSTFDPGTGYRCSCGKLYVIRTVGEPKRPGWYRATLGERISYRRSEVLRWDA